MCSRPEPAAVIRQYHIGEFLFEIESPPIPETERLGAFRTESAAPPVRRVCIRAVDAILVPDGAALRGSGESSFRSETGQLCRICRRDDGDGLLYRTTALSDAELQVEFARDCLAGLGSHLLLRWLELPRLLLARNAVFLHASYVAYQGKAILFTAPKQTGKSTQAALWEQYRGAEPINGDRALLCRRDGVWRAYGSPFCGSSNLCKNRTLELAAIVILRQGPENVIERANAKQILLSFLEGVTYDVNDRNAMEAVLDLAQQISAQVPFYFLSCLPDEGAVSCLHERLKSEGIYV